jgi:hypothetical protein
VIPRSAQLSRHRRDVGTAVVGQDPLDGDTAFGEPGHGPVEHTGSGEGLLVVVDLGVGHAGVVVDNGVHEARPDFGVVLPGLDAGAVAGGLAVVEALLLADVAPATAVGDVAELGDVDVDQLPGPGAFVAGRLAGDSVDVGEPVEPATGQDGVHG